MLTLFTTPKPFHGQIEIIQRNAIRSWCRLQSSARIILFGDDDGAAGTARDLGVVHVPDVGKNEYGTPLVSSMFAVAEQLTDSPLLCYVNADIILMSDFWMTAQRVSTRNRFLIVGRRWDLDMHTPWDFDQPDWERGLRAWVLRKATLHSVMGLDYFLYPRGLWGSLPPLAIGRTAWDNWLLYRARTRGGQLIDASQVVTAIHQNHGYAHHSEGEKGVWEGPEAQRNQELTGGPRYAFTLDDATHVMTTSGIWPALSLSHLKRRIVTAPLFHPYLKPVIAPVVQIARQVRKLARRTTGLAVPDGTFRG